MANRADIYVLGTGINAYRQVTKEAEAALEESDTIFAVQHQSVVFDYLDEFSAEVVDLHSLYESGVNRATTYRKTTERVIQGAKEADGPVTFAMYGHPMIFVSSSQQIQQEAPKQGLSVETLPGISSLDCLYAEFGIDPADHGMQIYDSTAMLLKEHPLRTDVPALLLQIGAVESGLYSEKSSKPKRFTRTREYLEQYYPSDHTIYLLQAASYPFTESEKIPVKLKNLESEYEDINHAKTLFLPQVEKREVRNEELADKVMSESHLKSITQD
jgi:uncharacterized protein YabN with tetrapyrrole methylase and pyrophosphatase domain